MSNMRSKFLNGLDGDDRSEARRRQAPTAVIVHEAIRKEGAQELERKFSALVWSGIGAGLSLGFSFLTEALLAYHLPDAKWSPLLTKLGYSVGFLIVVLGRQQLFTENTLTAILPLLDAWTSEILRKVARLWAIVLISNLAGAFVFAVLMVGLSHYDRQLAPELLKISQKGFEAGFLETFFSAIFAGWLIALMVWLLPFAETGRVFVIIIITYLIGLGKFYHIIAGTVDAIYNVLVTSTTVGDLLLSFFLPTLLGNIIGGVGFVAILNHAQVSPDQDEPRGSGVKTRK